MVDTKSMWGLNIISALQSLWTELQREYPELPHVVMITGTGLNGKNPKNGSFQPTGWHLTEEVTETKHHPEVERVEGGVLPAVDVTTTEEKERGLPEVFIAGERIAEGGLLVCQTVVHEAAHALGHARGIPTTGHGGRWHNKQFRDIAEELGMVRPETTDKSLGFSHMTLSEESAEKYKAWYEAFDNLPNLKGRLLVHLGTTAGTSPAPGLGRAGKRLAVECQCVPARRLQVSPKALLDGPIGCGVCGSNFEEAMI